MAEIAPFAVFLRVPVVGELDLGVVVAGRREEDQRESACFHVLAAELAEAELVAVEVQGFVEVGHADHRVQVFHRGFLWREQLNWLRL